MPRRRFNVCVVCEEHVDVDDFYVHERNVVVVCRYCFQPTHVLCKQNVAAVFHTPTNQVLLTSEAPPGRWPACQVYVCNDCVEGDD